MTAISTGVTIRQPPSAFVTILHAIVMQGDSAGFKDAVIVNGQQGTPTWMRCMLLRQ